MTKKLIFTIFICLAVLGNIFAQAPTMINYQGVALNTGGTAIANQNISIRASVHNLTPTGTILYSEERSITTDAGGLFNFQIGATGSTATSGSWAAITWSTSAKYLQVEMDATGGTNFIDMGTQQLVSVPYAQYSNLSGGLIPTATINPNQINTTGATTNQVLKYNGTSWVPGADVSAFNLPYAATDGSVTSFAITNNQNVNSTSIKGISSGTGSIARGVWGEATGTNGVGVYGSSTQDDAVFGNSTGGHGIHGKTTSVSNNGVFGEHTTGIAIKGQVTTGYGIMGEATGSSGRGVFGISNGATGIGVNGESASGTAVKGYGNNAGSYGVFGSSLAGTGVYANSFTGLALDVNGNVKIAGGNTNPSAGAILTSDASGNATWKTNKVVFKGFVSGTQNITHSTWTSLTNFTEHFDAGSNFNIHSAVTDPNTFIAPVSGYYQFTSTVEFALSSTVNNIIHTDLRFTINGAQSGVAHTNYGVWVASASCFASVNGTQTYHLNAGDKVKVQVSQSSDNSATAYVASAHFEGNLVFAD